MPTSQTELSAQKKLCPADNFLTLLNKSLNDTWVSRKVPLARLDGMGLINVSSSGKNW